MHPAVEFAALDEEHGDALPDSDGDVDEYKVLYSPTGASGGPSKADQAREQSRSRLAATSACLAQALLLLNCVVLTVLLWIDSPWQSSDEASCSAHIVEQVLMPLNVLLGLLALFLPLAACPWSRSRRSLKHAIVPPTVQVSNCDYVVPISDREGRPGDISIPEGAPLDCSDVDCDEFDGDSNPRLADGTCTPVEDLMHELMQVALSLCSAAPQECRGLLEHCSYEERQAVHLLGQMVRNHLFPDAEGTEDAVGGTAAPGMLSGFNMSMVSDGASKFETPGAHSQRWNMLNNAVNTFLFGANTSTDQQVSDAKVDIDNEGWPGLPLGPMIGDKPFKPVDSDRPTASPGSVDMIGTKTGSPSQDSASAGSAQSPREMSDEELDSPKSPFSVPEVSLTTPGATAPQSDKADHQTRSLTLKADWTGDFHLAATEETEVPCSPVRTPPTNPSSTNPSSKKQSRRGSNKSVGSQKSRKKSVQSAASRNDSRRSSLNSASSQFSATSFSDFNRRQSLRMSQCNSAGSQYDPKRNGKGPRLGGKDKSKMKGQFNSNGSGQSCRSGFRGKDPTRFNTGSSSHPSEVVRNLLNSIAAQPNEEIGGVSWGRDGCAASCSEMESERRASIKLADRYRERPSQNEDRSERQQNAHGFNVEDRRIHKASTVGNVGPWLDQELHGACEAVFPNSPRSQCGSRRASAVSVQDQREDGKRPEGTGSQALAVPVSGIPNGSRRGSLLSLSMASDAGKNKVRKASFSSNVLESPARSAVLEGRKSSMCSMYSVSKATGVSTSSCASARRLSNSMAFQHQGSERSSALEGDASWAQNDWDGCASATPSSAHSAGPLSRKKSNNRFTSVGSRLRDSLMKITGRRDDNKRSASSGALKRLNKWGLPKYVQQLFTSYGETLQANQNRGILGMKTVDELAAEVEAGLCRIVDGEQVTRVVQVCALRIRLAAADGAAKDDLVLVQKWHRSRKGGWFRKNALPSTKLRGQEEPREAAARMLQNEFEEFLDFLEFEEFSPLEELVQEKESSSYPGLLTRYMTTIVEVRIRPDVAVQALASMGLGPACPDHLKGSILMDSEAGETSYDWMQTKQCRIQGLAIAGVKDYSTLEVLKEEDQDSDEEGAKEEKQDPSELIRVLQEAAADAPRLTLKDFVREKGEILELTLEEIGNGLDRSGGNGSSTDIPISAKAGRYNTTPCHSTGSMPTNKPESEHTDGTPMSTLGPLPMSTLGPLPMLRPNGEYALPQRGSLFEIMAKMQGGPPHMEANLEERRRSWGEKSYALSESNQTVSTAALWRMAMQDWGCDSQPLSGTGINGNLEPRGVSKSSPPPLNRQDSRERESWEKADAAMYQKLCEKLEADPARLASKATWPPGHERPALAQNHAELEDDPKTRRNQEQSKGSSPEYANAAFNMSAIDSTVQSSRQESARESPATMTSASSTTPRASDVSQEEQARRYAQRKARLKAKKENADPAKVSYGEILRNSYEQFPCDAGGTEGSKPGPRAQAATVSSSPSEDHTASASEDRTAPASTTDHGSSVETNFTAGAHASTEAHSGKASSSGVDNDSEKARRYAERKARLKALKADAQPGKVNYGEILRNCYEQFPNAAAQASSADDKVVAGGNAPEQGGASSSTAVPDSAPPETAVPDCALLCWSTGSTADSSPRKKTEQVLTKSSSPDGLGTEGYWEVVRKLIAAGSTSPEPDATTEKSPLSHDEKVKQWKARKERRKKQEKTSKRPSYGSLLKKEASPMSSPRSSPTQSDEVFDVPQLGQTDMQINIVGAKPCSSSTSLFGGRQSTGSQSLGFQFSAGLVHANGRLSLPKTMLEPIPSPPGSRRASELERDEESQDGDSRRTLQADSYSGVDFQEDPLDRMSTPAAPLYSSELSDKSDKSDKVSLSLAVPHLDEEHRQCDEDEGSGLASSECSGSGPASTNYTREQRSTDTLEQAIKSLGD